MHGLETALGQMLGIAFSVCWFAGAHAFWAGRSPAEGRVVWNVPIAAMILAHVGLIMFVIYPPSAASFAALAAKWGVRLWVVLLVAGAGWLAGFGAASLGLAADCLAEWRRAKIRGNP